MVPNILGIFLCISNIRFFPFLIISIQGFNDLRRSSGANRIVWQRLAYHRTGCNNHIISNAYSAQNGAIRSNKYIVAYMNWHAATGEFFSISIFQHFPTVIMCN